MSATQNPPPLLEAQPHIKDVRSLMIDQLRALRTANPGDDLDAEVKRAKAVSEISQTIINSAKVEVDYLVATDQASAPFLEVPPDAHFVTPRLTTQPGEQNGITSIVRHRLQG